MAKNSLVQITEEELIAAVEAAVIENFSLTSVAGLACLEGKSIGQNVLALLKQGKDVGSQEGA